MKGTIEQFQNGDGGWPYQAHGPSWTEPTVYAILAQIALGNLTSPSVEFGLRWLQSMQAEDGGWRPQASVPQSTWVSALVALLPADLLPENMRAANINWLLKQTGQESTSLYRVRQWLTGSGNPGVSEGSGWAWYPGAAAWVTPTALTIVALKKHKLALKRAGAAGAVLDARIQEGQRFLMLHACAGGGWNHGGTHALGYQANPYPETTGVALLALRGTDSMVKQTSVRVADRFLLESRSVEGFAWLSLGLRASGKTQLPIANRAEPRTMVDLALLALADRAYAGNNTFLTET